MAKHVYNNDGLAHAWFNEYNTLGHGRNSNDSFYFNGATIFSYGSHFPIARIIELDRNIGQYDKIVVLTTAGYSNTTSRHISEVRSAIDENRAIIVHTPDVNGVRTLNDAVEAALENADNTYMRALEHAESRKENDYMFGVYCKDAEKAIWVTRKLNKITGYSNNYAIQPEKRGKLKDFLRVFSQEGDAEKYLQMRRRQAQAQREAKAEAKRREFILKHEATANACVRLIYTAEAQMADGHGCPDSMTMHDHIGNVKAFPQGKPKTMLELGDLPTNISISRDRIVNLLIKLAGSLTDAALKRYARGEDFHKAFSLGQRSETIFLRWLLRKRMVSDWNLTVPELSQLEHETAGARKLFSELYMQMGTKRGCLPPMNDMFTDSDIWVLFNVLSIDLKHGYKAFHPEANAMLWFDSSKGRVRTSMGVEIGVNVFRKYCEYLDEIEEHGVGALPDKMRSVNGCFRIHGYKDGIVTIGCHRIPMVNIKDVGAQVCKSR